MGVFNSNWLRRRGGALPTIIPAGMDLMPGAMGVQDSSSISPDAAHDLLWVIYASETGVAEHLAENTYRTLQDAGVASRLLLFDQLKLDALQVINQAFFVVSTCYDGDLPDMADEFCRAHMQRPAPLPGLRYGMLALGDSYYDEFCGFGRRLHQWLQASGAQALFEPVEMDDEDEVAARCWHDRIGDVIQRAHAAGRPTA